MDFEPARGGEGWLGDAVHLRRIVPVWRRARKGLSVMTIPEVRRFAELPTREL
jgi:hypothetical protein